MSITLDGLINGSYDFKAIIDKVKSIYDAVMGNGNISSWWETFTGYLDMVPAIAVSGVLLLLSLVMVFFGKRLLGLTKFLAFFAAGFGLGVAYLAIHIPSSINFPHWIVGIVVGVVCALLSRVLYFAAYVGVAGYSAYLASISGYILPEFTKGNKIIALVFAAVAIVVCLLLKKLIEMLGTATLGGYLASLCILEMFSQLNLNLESDLIVMIIKIAVIVLCGVFGFVVQYKTRKRKW